MKSFANLIRQDLKNFPKRVMKFKYKDLQYSYNLPVQPVWSFKKLLDRFGEEHFNGEKSHKDFEIFRQGEYLLFDEKVQDYNLKEAFDVYDAKLTEESLKQRDSKYLVQYWGLTGEGKPIEGAGMSTDFFDYIFDYINKHKIKVEETNKFDVVNSPFETTSEEKEIEPHSMLYNENTIGKIKSPSFKIKDLDEYKIFFTQLFGAFLEINKDKNLIIDINQPFSGINTNEYNADLLIKNPDGDFLLPITVLPSLDYRKVFDEARDYAIGLYFKQYLPYNNASQIDPDNLTKSQKKFFDDFYTKDGKL